MQHFVDERIIGAAQAPEFPAVVLEMRGVGRGDDQYLEIGAVTVLVIERWRQKFRQGDLGLFARLPQYGIMAIGTRGKAFVDTLGQRGKSTGIGALQPLLKSLHETQPGKRKEILQRDDFRQRAARGIAEFPGVLATCHGRSPGTTDYRCLGPMVGARIRDGKAIGNHAGSTHVQLLIIDEFVKP